MSLHDDPIGRMVDHVADAPLRARPWVIRLVTTLVAWSVAFVIVLALLELFGHTLESLPFALNALVFTGVLVPIMGNLVMPIVSGAVARRLNTADDSSRRQQ
jgi:antibiotic biosynthesis monooxygenase (ABM) superfamily enzyme